MKLTVKYDEAAAQAEVTVVCNAEDKTAEEIISYIGLFDDTVSGKSGGQTHLISLREVLYFESVDGRIFFYTKDSVYESPVRLYQLEEKLKGTAFERVSKSALINLKKLKSIVSERNGRLMGTLCNGEKVLISRQYVRGIKNKLGV